MRRLQSLLILAGLVAAPTGAAAKPDADPWDSHDDTAKSEKFDWSMAKGRLGALVTSMTPELRQHFGANKNQGVLVARVEPGSPAAVAGLQVGDVIVQVRGHTIEDASDVMSAISGLDKGQKVSIQVIRNGKSKTLEAMLTEDDTTSSFLHELLRPFTTPKPSPDSA